MDSAGLDLECASVGGVESTNLAKFRTRNPVVRRLIDRFYGRLETMVEPLAPGSLLDAGCGEGETIARLDSLLPARVAAVDLSPDAVEFTARRFPAITVTRQSVYDLPFDDGAFELVLCLEVLEHLEDPGAAVTELARVSSGRLIVSVPHEPWFRIGSLLRGNYVTNLGNHPEHVNHWTAASLRLFLESRAELLELGASFPWLLASCRRARAAPGS